jgi:hypothetical protein
MEDHEVYSFTKNAEETVRVALTEFKGHRLLDVRVYVKGQARQLIPTRKGLTLSRDLIGELLEGLRLAAKAIEGRDA